MGISGANFAIAESGALGLVTNEGNMRLVTTMPRVHVALVGYDKLIPDLKTMLRILKVLPRNATGQAITSYVTWIKGAVECGASPSNRKIMHIVFLDNGRLALAKDPVFSPKRSGASDAGPVPMSAPSTARWAAINTAMSTSVPSV